MASLREPPSKPKRNLKRFDLQIVKNAIHQLCIEVNDSLTIEELKEKVEESLRRKFRFSFLPLLHKFDNNFFVEDYCNSKLIKAKTTLELCPSHSGIRKKCDKNCNKLHICKFYLLSNSCTFKGNRCRFGHNLESDYNKALLEYHDLEELDVDELRILFKSPLNRCQVTQPPICKFYNLEKGCSKEDGCKFLHICKPYLTGSCRFGRRCRRNHNIFQPQLKELLVKYGINTKQSAIGILVDLEECFAADTDDDVSDSDDEAPVPGASLKYRNRDLTRSKSNPSFFTMFTGKPSLSLACSCDIDEPRVRQAESNEICIYYLRGNCRYGARCNMQHKDSMYQWQFKDTRGKWTDYRPAANVEIEQKYCDVYNVDCCIQFGKQMRMNIDYIQMTGNKKGTIINIRRLSTESSAVQKFQPLATEYKWYWEDQRERWIVYGGQNVTGYAAILDSESLEMNYHENPCGQMRFKTSGHDYIMDFQKMVQKNVFHKTERCVRRRPVFVCAEDVELKKRKSADTGTMKRATSCSTLVLTPLSYDQTSSIPSSWSFDKRRRPEDLIHHYSLSSGCQSVRSYGCQSVKSSGCQSVKSAGCQSVVIWCQSVKPSGCQSVKSAGCQSVKSSGCQSVKSSGCQSVKSAGCQSVVIWVSKCKIIWVSKCKVIWLSKCKVIWVSKCKIIWLSKCKVIWLSKCKVIWLSKCKVIWLSKCKVILVSDRIVIYRNHIVQLSGCHMIKVICLSDRITI
ncbi:PARP7S [Mytilus edulis]|uniref:PARP7S n=1 Tax=Mytilus edulis TaxID=6550 RepID=A0A8S3VP30_MYTED|nr:PARP7S [Mytilus edulis]